MNRVVRLISLACILLLTGERARGADHQTEGSADIKSINDYSVELLREGKAEEALQVLQAYKALALRSDALNCRDRSIYFYNLGQASEELSKLEPALHHFFYSFELCTSFQPSLRAALRLAEQIPNSKLGLQVTTDIASRLIKENDLGTAEEVLRSALANSLWWQDDINGLLSQTVTRYLTAASIGPQEFHSDWLSAIQGYAAKAQPRWFEFLVLAYSDQNIPVVLGKIDTSELYRTCYEIPGGTTSLPWFLRMVGDSFFKAGEEQLAFQRYALAWSIRKDSPELALSLLNVVANGSQNVDPEASAYNAVTTRFRKSPGSLKAEDRQSIARMESLLAQLAAKPLRSTTSSPQIQP